MHEPPLISLDPHQDREMRYGWVIICVAATSNLLARCCSHRIRLCTSRNSGLVSACTVLPSLQARHRNATHHLDVYEWACNASRMRSRCSLLLLLSMVSEVSCEKVKHVPLGWWSIRGNVTEWGQLSRWIVQLSILAHCHMKPLYGCLYAHRSSTAPAAHFTPVKSARSSVRLALKGACQRSSCPSRRTLSTASSTDFHFNTGLPASTLTNMASRIIPIALLGEGVLLPHTSVRLLIDPATFLISNDLSVNAISFHNMQVRLLLACRWVWSPSSNSLAWKARFLPFVLETART